MRVRLNLCSRLKLFFLTSEVFACPKLEFQRSGSRIFTSTSDIHHNGGRHTRPLVVLLLCRQNEDTWSSHQLGPTSVLCKRNDSSRDASCTWFAIS